MFRQQDASRRGRHRHGKTRRSRSRALGIEALETRALLSVGIISTVAGTGVMGDGGDDGPATKATLNDCSGVALDAAGDIFIADEYYQVIREVVESSSTAASLRVAVGDIITVAGINSSGNFLGGYSGDGGKATKAELNYPTGVGLDPDGDIFIADSDNDRIREVIDSASASAAFGLPIGDIITVAGDGTSGTSGNGGPATRAELDGPTAVAVDGLGDVFIADQSNNVVREVNGSSGDISTVAGTGAPSYTGDGGPDTQADLAGPAGVALNAEDDLFIADSINNVIRAVLPAPVMTLSASAGSAVSGQPIKMMAIVTAPFGFTATGTVTFSSSGTPLGTAPLDGSGTATLTISSLAPGADSITASFSGDMYFAGASAGLSAPVSVAQASSKVMLVGLVGLKKHKVVSLKLEAQVTPVAPATGVPTGTVVFELLQKGKKKPKVLGMLALDGGTATLPVRPARVRNKLVTVLYDGDADFQASTFTAKIRK
jgi:hypothetical protein